MSHDKSIGSRAEVFHGTAKHTSGGLTKKDLLKNKHGRIVSRSKHASAKKEQRLLKHGYGTKKGEFGYVKKTPRAHKSAKKHYRGAKKSHNKTRRMAGGMHTLMPAALDGSAVDMQKFAAIEGDAQQMRATTVGGAARSRGRGRAASRARGMAGGFLAPLAII